MLKKKLQTFHNRLITKAQGLLEERKTLLPKKEGELMGQENAVKFAQLAIRALTLLDIADVLATIIAEE